MAPDTDGPEPGRTDDMEPVSRNPEHFRFAHWPLLALGVVLVALAIGGFVSAAMHPHAGPTGAPLAVLNLTVWHSVVLLVAGIAAVAGAWQRRAAVITSAVEAVAFVVLVILGAVAASKHDPGPLGLDDGDLILHGAIVLANFAILYWLLPDALEGRDWVPLRRRSRRSGRSS